MLSEQAVSSEWLEYANYYSITNGNKILCARGEHGGVKERECDSGGVNVYIRHKRRKGEKRNGS
jgi:hypothetical protein